MFAKSYTATVLENTWVTSTVMRLRFESHKDFVFKGGQFVSVVVPPSENNEETLKRCYSLASTPDESKNTGIYELCVKYVPGGAGSSYIASLQKGDTFAFLAPYGEFNYKPALPGRSVCFISTGTGIAPFRSILLSEKFLNHRPSSVINIVGVRSEDEILYAEDFAKKGIKTVYAVSQPSEKFTGFKGRVTDYLQTLSNGRWHMTDFYLCGNGEMVSEVVEILRSYGVPLSAIHREAFSAKKANGKVPASEKKLVLAIQSLKQTA